MPDDNPMTRKQTEDLIENAALKFTQIVSEKFEEHGNKQKEEQRLARENTFEQGTGFPWEHRGEVKKALNYSLSSQKASVMWRGTGIVVVGGLIIEKIWEVLFNAGA